MMHVVATMMFLGSGMFALAVIAAMLIDEAPAIARALCIGAKAPPLPLAPSRVRVLRSPRLMPMSPVRLREAA